MRELDGAVRVTIELNSGKSAGKRYEATVVEQEHLNTGTSLGKSVSDAVDEAVERAMRRIKAAHTA